MLDQGLIPKRWDRFTKMGTVIKGTRLLPMKTPLDGSLLEKSEYTEGFDIDEVIEQDVGLIICLVKLGCLLSLYSSIFNYSTFDL